MFEDYEKSKHVIDHYYNQDETSGIIPFLSDIIPETRAYALEILYRMNADEAKDHADRMKDDISEAVKKIAERILFEEKLEKTGEIMLTLSNPFAAFEEKEAGAKEKEQKAIPGTKGKLDEDMEKFIERPRLKITIRDPKKK
ncbi:MAG: hypothetical protein HY754_08310 [Nitrospirae bacterium]|nr:hypothetical protein [Nitrospirota bacterium]